MFHLLLSHLLLTHLLLLLLLLLFHHMSHLAAAYDVAAPPSVIAASLPSGVVDDDALPSGVFCCFCC